MRFALALLAFGSLLGLGCSSSVDPSAFKGNVQVSFATQSPTPAPPAPPAPLVRAPASPAGDTIRSGGNTLVIAQAQIVLRKIELKRIETTACQTQAAGCSDVEVGPVLVDLPLGGLPQQKFAVQIPPGSYGEIDFEVHKLSGGDTQDATLLQGHPEFQNKSIRVLGTFNGQSFTYETDLDVEQELPLSPALAVSGASTNTNLTIRVVLAAWFTSASGGLLNPATGNKGGANEGVIKDNIKNSMKAFEDRDRDGKEG